MERIIQLLNEKNTYLEKFYYMNEQELLNFADGNFDSVEAFYQARDKVLDLISCLDGLIEEENTGDVAMVTDSQRNEAREILRSKDELVKAILAQDLQLLTFIEKEKSNIIRELRDNSTARRAAGAYANTERNAAMTAPLKITLQNAAGFGSFSELDEEP